MDIHVPIIGDTTIVWMVDTTLYFVAGLTALLVFFQSDRLTIIKRFCLHYTVMQVMRTICLLVTNLPDCSDLCREITYPFSTLLFPFVMEPSFIPCLYTWNAVDEGHQPRRSCSQNLECHYEACSLCYLWWCHVQWSYHITHVNLLSIPLLSPFMTRSGWPISSPWTTRYWMSSLCLSMSLSVAVSLALSKYVSFLWQFYE